MATVSTIAVRRNPFAVRRASRHKLGKLSARRLPRRPAVDAALQRFRRINAMRSDALVTQLQRIAIDNRYGGQGGPDHSRAIGFDTPRLPGLVLKLIDRERHRDPRKSRKSQQR